MTTPAMDDTEYERLLKVRKNLRQLLKDVDESAERAKALIEVKRINARKAIQDEIRRIDKELDSIRGR